MNINNKLKLVITISLVGYFAISLWIFKYSDIPVKHPIDRELQYYYPLLYNFNDFSGHGRKDFLKGAGPDLTTFKSIPGVMLRRTADSRNFDIDFRSHDFKDMDSQTIAFGIILHEIEPVPDQETGELAFFLNIFRSLSQSLWIDVKKKTLHLNAGGIHVNSRRDEATKFYAEKYYYITIAYSAKLSTVTLFRDGQKIGERNLGDNYKQIEKIGSGNSLSIGDGEKPYTSIYGVLNELSFWSRSLSNEEVREAYNYVQKKLSPLVFAKKGLIFFLFTLLTSVFLFQIHNIIFYLQRIFHKFREISVSFFGIKKRKRWLFLAKRLGILEARELSNHKLALAIIETEHPKINIQDLGKSYLEGRVDQIYSTYCQNSSEIESQGQD